MNNPDPSNGPNPNPGRPSLAGEASTIAIPCSAAASWRLSSPIQAKKSQTLPHAFNPKAKVSMPNLVHRGVLLAGYPSSDADHLTTDTQPPSPLVASASLENIAGGTQNGGQGFFGGIGQEKNIYEDPRFHS